ncbi:MAG: hypothetical protein U1E18_06870, partial [Brevundimonas sp.]|uniref:hypothetical protein n=1 Tax=Brevundimonas sp. TaxID=1871086 RepID=UPI002ABB17D2
NDIGIAAEAPGACLITAGPSASGRNASFTSGATGGEMRILQLVDPLTAEVLPTEIRLALPVICNAGHSVVVRTTRGGLTRDGAAAPAAPGFRNQVPYQLAVDWAGATSNQTSASPGVVIDQPGAAAGDLQLNITIPEGGAPLVAGAYSDQVVIELRVTS